VAGKMMDEQRKYSRQTSAVSVEITHPSFPVMELKARDLSDGGVFVFLGSHMGPPVGTVVKARIKRHTGTINAEPVDMRIVHHSNGGMGLSFMWDNTIG
jgi:hypothetical protein